MRALGISYSVAVALTFWTIVVMELNVFVVLHEVVPFYLYCVPVIAGVLVFIVFFLNPQSFDKSSIKAWLLMAIRGLAVVAIVISLFFVVVAYKSGRIDFIEVNTRNISAFNLKDMEKNLGFKVSVAMDKNDIKIYFLKGDDRRSLVQLEEQKILSSLNSK
jgi:hypothetical protein